MKVLQTNQTETVACDDECGDKNAVIESNQHKLNDIQDLLKAHNTSEKNER